jgi:hypothetical protein
MTMAGQVAAVATMAWMLIRFSIPANAGHRATGVEPAIVSAPTKA